MKMPIIANVTTFYGIFGVKEYDGLVIFVIRGQLYSPRSFKGPFLPSSLIKNMMYEMIGC